MTPVLALSFLEIVQVVLSFPFLLAFGTFLWRGLRALLGYRPPPDQPEPGPWIALAQAGTLLAIIASIVAVKACNQHVLTSAFEGELARYRATRSALVQVGQHKVERLPKGRVVVLDTSTNDFDKDFGDYPTDVRAERPEDVRAVVWVTRGLGDVLGHMRPSGNTVHQKVVAGVPMRLVDNRVIASNTYARSPGTTGPDRLWNDGEVDADAIVPFLRNQLR